jgi:HEAT repeat protein
MSDTPTPRDLRGLSRTVDDLFAGREPESRELPPPVVEPTVDEPDAEEPTAEEPDPGDPAVHAADVTAGPPPSAPPADGPEPEARGQGTALRKALAAFVAASEEARPAMAEAVRREVDRLRDARDGAALADGVERLVRARSEDRGALALAGEMVSPGVAGVLTARLRSAARDEARQEELVRVIRRLGDEMVRSVADALTMTDDRAERRVLLRALSALAPDNPEIVRELLDDPRWFVVRNAVQVVGETGDEEAVQHLTAPLAHDHPKVRREVLVALARIGGGDAAMLALSKVEDPAPEVRAAAAMALGELRLQRAQRPLLEQLEREEDEDVAVQIVRALGALGDPGAVPALEKRATGSFFSKPPQAVRLAAYRALGAIGTPHARKLIAAATDDRDEEVRGVAAQLVTAMTVAARQKENRGPVPAAEGLDGGGDREPGGGGAPGAAPSEGGEDPPQRPGEA